MIAYLQGKIILKKDLKKEKFIVLDVNGIGYKVFLSKKTFALLCRDSSRSDEKQLKDRPAAALFCYLYVRENAMDLYGFMDWGQRETFELLIGISGVGPKAALEISSFGPIDALKKSIEAGDAKIFEGISGIGRKRAGKILLELSGRIKDFSASASQTGPALEDDACALALINMGFSKAQVRQALARIPKQMSDEERVKQALKTLR